MHQELEHIDCIVFTKRLVSGAGHHFKGQQDEGSKANLVLPVSIYQPIKHKVFKSNPEFFCIDSKACSISGYYKITYRDKYKLTIQMLNL